MQCSSPRPARFGVILLTYAWIASTLGGTPALGGNPVDFDREIRPILSEHCYACHGPDQKARKADLRLDRKDDAFRDRAGYAVIVPGQGRGERADPSRHCRRSRRADAAAEIQEAAERAADRSPAPVGRRGGEVGRPLVLYAAGERRRPRR